MTIKSGLLVASAAAALLIAQSAGASVVTFEGSPAGLSTCALAPVSFGGLTFTPASYACTLSPTDYVNWPEQPASEIEVFYAAWTVATTAGGSFNLDQLDMQLGTYSPNLGGSDTLTVTGHEANGGTLNTTLTLTDPMVTQTLGWTDLSSVSFSVLAGGGYEGIDNVVYEAVPEPATWAMMLVGVGLIGASIRRKGLRPVRA